MTKATCRNLEGLMPLSTFSGFLCLFFGYERTIWFPAGAGHLLIASVLLLPHGEVPEGRAGVYLQSMGSCPSTQAKAGAGTGRHRGVAKIFPSKQQLLESGWSIAGLGKGKTLGRRRPDTWTTPYQLPPLVQISTVPHPDLSVVPDH